MTTAERIARVRHALCDPDAPWYGSDLVPWVDDLMFHVEQAESLLVAISGDTVPAAQHWVIEQQPPAIGHRSFVLQIDNQAWLIHAGRVHPKT